MYVYVCACVCTSALSIMTVALSWFGYMVYQLFGDISSQILLFTNILNI